VIFTRTELAGVVIVDLDPREDERGFFARAWCAREFREAGLPDRIVQASISRNRKRGTLRGLHYQVAPHDEDKLVRCTRGALLDVAVDLRPDSPTHLRHVAVELRADTGRALFIPRGFAHGFQTLEDDTDVFYQMTAFHEPGAGRGLRWSDPRLGIRWPITPPILHPRDAAYPDLLPLA
jgi:dTDP-4-dehydrorhamnose 3,5-epimerase